MEESGISSRALHLVLEILGQSQTLKNLRPNSHKLQYTCDSHPTNNTLRDGSKTTTITNTAAGDQDPTSGRHESYQYYSDCRARQRNRGLFTADRNMRDDIGATSTRQNENGNR